MNILLINPYGLNSFINPPLGLLYIAASLEKASHKVFIKDFDLESYKSEALKLFIEAHKIDVAGISIVTPKVYNAYDIATYIKEQYPHITLVAGGPHATLLPEEVLTHCPSFDYIIQGEGELRFCIFLEALENQTGFDRIDGLAFKQDNHIKNAPPHSFIKDLDALPPPAWHLIKPMLYSKHMKTLYKPAISMITSRGCPYKCIYCSKPVTGSKLRAESPEKVIEEIKHLVKTYGIKEIVFYDDVFTLDKKRLFRLCDLLIEGNLQIKWHCETRVNLVDWEILLKMKEAGCYMIAYGIESGSEKTLETLQKGVSLAQIKNSIALTHKAGIKTLGYFMLGIPGESIEDIEKTLSFSKTLDVDYAQFSVATAYPCTPLYKMTQKAIINPHDWSKSVYALGGKPTISLSDVPVETLYKYVKKAYYTFYMRPSYLIKRLKELTNYHYFIYYIRGLKKLIKA